MSGYWGPFFIMALVLAVLLGIGSFMAYRKPSFDTGDDPPPLKVWIIITLVVYFALLAALAYSIINREPTLQFDTNRSSAMLFLGMVQ